MSVDDRRQNNTKNAFKMPGSNVLTICYVEEFQRVQRAVRADPQKYGFGEYKQRAERICQQLGLIFDISTHNICNNTQCPMECFYKNQRAGYGTNTRRDEVRYFLQGTPDWDHAIPVCKDEGGLGQMDILNMQLLCAKCNRTLKSGHDTESAVVGRPLHLCDSEAAWYGSTPGFTGDDAEGWMMDCRNAGFIELLQEVKDSRSDQAPRTVADLSARPDFRMDIFFLCAFKGANCATAVKLTAGEFQGFLESRQIQKPPQSADFQKTIEETKKRQREEMEQKEQRKAELAHMTIARKRRERACEQKRRRKGKKYYCTRVGCEKSEAEGFPEQREQRKRKQRRESRLAQETSD